MSILLTTGCHRTKPKVEEPFRTPLNRFFKELMLDHGGIYTLCGHKPMTIESIYYYEDEDFGQIENYLENHPEIEYRQVERYLDETLPYWKEFSKTFRMKNFILTEIHPEEFSAKESLLLFINVKETQKVLQRHYEDFKAAFGKEFNSLEQIHSLKNGDDEFWKAIFRDKALLGMLLGYGYKNSIMFEEHKKNQIELPAEYCDIATKVYQIEGVSIQLPQFVQFDKDESLKILQKYEVDRKKIGKTFKKKPFLETTLLKLSE